MSDFTLLRSGFAMRTSVLMLALDLERRCVTLAVTADGKLTAAPREKLTAEDIAAIREHKRALLGLLAYVHDGTDHAAHLRG